MRLLKIVIPVLFLSCSPDLIPVHYSRVKSARTGGAPLLLDKNSPGYFSVQFDFDRPAGFRFDPAEVEVSPKGTRLRPSITKPFSILETSVGHPFSGLMEWVETPSPRHQGELRYQISPDSSHWYYYENARWRPALAQPRQANTALELQKSLPHFHNEIGGGHLFLRIFLIKNKSQGFPELKNLRLSGILPLTDGWD